MARNPTLSAAAAHGRRGADPGDPGPGHEVWKVRRPAHHGVAAECGWPVGKDRVQRIWRREGLKVPQKPRILSAIACFHQLCVNAYFAFRYIAPRILFLKMGTGESFGQPDAAQQVGKAAIGAEAVQFGAKRRGRNRTARRQLIVRESGLELSCSLNLAKQRARGSCTAPPEVCLSGS